MNVPKLRFKGFQDAWIKTNFENAKIQIIDGDRGENYPKSEDFYANGFCLFLNAGNVTKQGFNFENMQFISKEKNSSLRKGKLIRDDLVITTRGTVGNVAYFNHDVPFEHIRINSGMVIVRSHEDFSRIFIYQFLKSSIFDNWLARHVFGSAQPQLTVKLLKSLGFTYPKLEEQTKIASFLSAVDDKIACLVKEHELWQQYKQGMMQQLFSQTLRFQDDDGQDFPEWEEDFLGSFCQIKTGKLDANAMQPNGQYRFYTCAKEYSFIDNYAFDTEALLISGNGAHVGNIHYYKGKFNAYQRTYVLDNWVHNIIYIKFFLERFLKERIFSEKKEGNTPCIVLSTLSEMLLKIPCLEEQTKIAACLSAIDAKIDSVAQQLEQARVWKQGLLQQMFV